MRRCYNNIMALVRNKKVGLDYEILDTFEAGLVLHGFEVKAIKMGRGSLEGAYVIIRGGEAFLVRATIPPYQPGNTPKSYDPERARRLLLNKKELHTLLGAEQGRGLTIVPISLYSKGTKIKAEIAIVRGKKKYDKRETIKKRDVEREIRRTLKNR